MYVPIILGTAREGRQSEKVAGFILKEAQKYGFESEIIDVKDFLFSFTDKTLKNEKAKEYAKKISKADGLIIVSPEYNHGYPGELKILLDSAYSQYFHKPLGFCGVSIGIFGGARAVEQLRQVAVELHMIPIREAMYFSNIASLFNDNGTIKDENYYLRIKTFFDEISFYIANIKK